MELMIEIIDVLGRKMFAQKVILSEYIEKSVPLENLPGNVYFVKVSSPCSYKVVKFYKS